MRLNVCRAQTRPDVEVSVINNYRKSRAPGAGKPPGKRFAVFFVILACCAVFCVQGAASSDKISSDKISNDKASKNEVSNEIKWFSYDTGKAAAKKEGKKIFLHFRADWCSYCRLMSKETFKDPAVIAYLNANYIPITVNSDKETGLAQKYKVQGLPLNWFLEENGEKIGNRPGYISPSDLISFLKFIHTNSYKTMTLSRFLRDRAE